MLALSFTVSADAKKKKKKDKRSPYVVLATTLDSDGNGKIDGMMLKYSEVIKVASIKAPKTKKGKKKKKYKASTRLPYVVTGHQVRLMKIGSDRKSVVLTISEGTKIDTGVTPTIGYFKAKPRAKGVLDKAKNQALTGLISPRDGAPPTLLGSSTGDSDADGQIDSIALNFSENVANADKSLFSVSGHAITGAATSGATATLTIDETGVDTGARPPVTVAAAAIEDEDDNKFLAAAPVTPADAAPPVVVGAVTGDANIDGKLDTIATTFSEPVTHAAETGAGKLHAIGYTTTSVSAASGAVINFTFNQLTSFDTSGVPPVTVQASGESISDAAGNAAQASTFAGTLDGAAPVLVSAKLVDNSPVDGKIDGIEANFSETVSYTQVIGAFSSTANPSALGVLTQTGTVFGAKLTLAVTQISSGYNTDLPTLGNPVPITYTPQSGGGVIDGRSLPAAAKTVQATDGAGPAIVSALTADSDHNGMIDGMTVGFSEPITTLNGQPFSVASGLRTVRTDVGHAPSLSAGNVVLELQEQTAPDGADRPTIKFTASTGNNAADAGNNAVPTTTAPFTATGDGVEPIMVGASTADADNDGKIDNLQTVWTEPVTTTSSPVYTITAIDEPAGYTGPSVGSSASGTTPASPILSVPLVEGSAPDRDLSFQIDYDGPGVADIATAPNGGYNSGPLNPPTPSVCADGYEPSVSTFVHDDSATPPDVPNSSSLSTPGIGNEYFSTLCGGDADVYSFNVTDGQTTKILFSPADEALSLAGRDGSWNPFTVTGPGDDLSPTLTAPVYQPSMGGWVAEFTENSATNGPYRVKIQDSNSPVADYGYCLNRVEGADVPACSVRQGDLTISELFAHTPGGVTGVGPYVEFINTSGQLLNRNQIDGEVNLEVDPDGASGPTIATSCTLTQRAGQTPATFASRALIVVSDTDFASITNDFDCPGMPTLDYDAQIRLMTNAGGEIDQIDFDAVNISSTQDNSMELIHDGTNQYETSTANDNPAGWCVSYNYFGTPGANNDACDQYEISEVNYLPSSATARDGKVFIEIHGNAPLIPGSPLLGNWRIRVKPHASTSDSGNHYHIFTLPPFASPTSNGYYVLADQPNAGGDTYVPFYSSQVTDLSTYLRADGPVSVKILRPGSATGCSTGSEATDTLGYLPNSSAIFDSGDNDACGFAYLGNPFGPPVIDSEMVTPTIQRGTNTSGSVDNKTAYCINDPWSPRKTNASCLTTN